MKLSRDEQRAVAFIGLLLALSAAVRLADRQPVVEVDGPAVDLAELEAESRRRLEGRTGAGQRAPAASPATAPVGRSSPGAVQAGTPAARAPVDINRASVEELQALPGIGEVLARRIVAYRDSVRGFRTVEQLEQVRGIGPAMMRRLTPLIRVGI